jgi:hypothetical protein
MLEMCFKYDIGTCNFVGGCVFTLKKILGVPQKDITPVLFIETTYLTQRDQLNSSI